MHDACEAKYSGIHLCAAKIFKISYTELRFKSCKSSTVILVKPNSILISMYYVNWLLIS